MLQAIDALTDALVPSAEARREGRYVCPECKALVGLRAGAHKVPHFAHFARSRCALAEPESQRHLALKWLCRQLFSPATVEWEVCIGSRRADVLVGGALAVECQVSPLSIDEWSARTLNHNVHGYPVLWLWDVKRLCRKNTLAEALVLEQRNRAVWVPAEARFCHEEGHGLLCTGDKHGIRACRLDKCDLGNRRHAPSLPDAFFWPDAVRSLSFLPPLPIVRWAARHSKSGRFRLAEL
jgi:hypothetical protein